MGLYLHPPENAVVLCVDEKPAIQALERAQGWLRLPNGEALRGFSHFHYTYTPTHASWLNQVEVWFSLLTRGVFQELSATSVRDVCRAIDAFTDARNQHPMPFEWTKSIVHPVGLPHRYANLRK